MKPITLAAAGLRERAHLQEWVIANPEILGEGMLVITSEFDRWVSQAGKDPDRLDVLGLETSGRLVVAELKRDTAPESVSLQAINYAARASRFTPELLAEAYLDGSWYVIDATRLSNRRSLVRMATGRDAADCAFLSYHGGYVGLERMRIDAVVVPDDGAYAEAAAAHDAAAAASDPALDDFAELVQLA